MVCDDSRTGTIPLKTGKGRNMLRPQKTTKTKKKRPKGPQTSQCEIRFQTWVTNCKKIVSVCLGLKSQDIIIIGEELDVWLCTGNENAEFSMNYEVSWANAYLLQQDNALSHTRLRICVFLAKWLSTTHALFSCFMALPKNKNRT